MRYLRLLAPLLLAAWCAALMGCGGGSGGKAVGTRKVTITVRWPSTTGKATGRVVPQTAQSVTVEAFDGTLRVGQLSLSNSNGVPSVAGTLALPVKPLAFYVNAYEDATDHLNRDGYKTDVKTGQPARLINGVLTPLSGSDLRPVARAFMAVDTPPADLTFSLANNIASFVQVPSKSTYPLDQGSVLLNDTIQARTADGATVLVSPTALTWSMDAGNALENKRAALNSTPMPNPYQTDPKGTAPQLNLLATGEVHVTVTDNEVTPNDPVNNGNPIKATLTYTITPFTAQRTITLNTAANALLTTSVPLYAKSLTYTLSQDTLVAAGTGAVLDNPPAAVNSAPFPVTPVYENNNTSISSVTLPAIPVPFTHTGRTLTLTVSAWSRPDGTGALLAQQTLPHIAPGNSTQDFLPLASRVTGFRFTPDNPVITINSTGSNFSGSGVNTLQIQVDALVNGNDPAPVPIDPRAVTLTSDNPQIAAISIPLTPLDANGNPYALLTGGTVGNATPTAVPIRAADKQHPTLTGMTTLTVQRYTLGYVFK